MWKSEVEIQGAPWLDENIIMFSNITIEYGRNKSIIQKRV